MAITKAAIKRQFVVVAFSSLDRELHRCWDTTYPPEKSADVSTVGSGSPHSQCLLGRSGAPRPLGLQAGVTIRPLCSVQVTMAWQELLERENWGRIPHYALGGSSGGAFVLLLAQRVPLDGVCPVIMAAQPHTLDVKPRTLDSSKSWNFPPTFFVYMERDELTMEGVASNVAALKKQVTCADEACEAPPA